MFFNSLLLSDGSIVGTNHRYSQMTASEIKFAMFDGKLAWNRSSLVKKESEQESNSLVKSRDGSKTRTLK